MLCMQSFCCHRRLHRYLGRHAIDEWCRRLTLQKSDGGRRGADASDAIVLLRLAPLLLRGDGATKTPRRRTLIGLGGVGPPVDLHPTHRIRRLSRRRDITQNRLLVRRQWVRRIGRRRWVGSVAGGGARASVHHTPAVPWEGRRRRRRDGGRALVQNLFDADLQRYLRWEGVDEQACLLVCFAGLLRVLLRRRLHAKVWTLALSPLLSLRAKE